MAYFVGETSYANLQTAQVWTESFVTPVLSKLWTL